MVSIRQITAILLISAFILPLCSQVSMAEKNQNPDVAIGNAQDGMSVDELLEEAESLFTQGHLIDARARLLKAVAADPKDYRPQMMLGAYYLTEVGHFRLALRYLESAQKLFKKQFPTEDSIEASERAWRDHARILILLSNTHLNLDHYEKALSLLETFGETYWDPSIPASRAWILMKLGKLDEGIRAAQAGLLRGGSPGSTLNVLAILFSLKDNRRLALEAFSRAARAEMALGGSGQIATPLNNAGEVHRELFEDGFAEASWKAALNLPDGCEHILTSMNTILLLTDQLRLFNAQRVLHNFEACFAQNPLRSDTEHRGLLRLARGRLAMRLGNIDEAIQLLRETVSMKQWFGKIGTSVNDFKLATHLTLAQALNSKAATLSDIIAEDNKAWIGQSFITSFFWLKAIMNRGKTVWL